MAGDVSVNTGFWPQTLGAWAAIVAALLGAVATVLANVNRNKGNVNSQKIDDVHTLVDGNFSEVNDQLQKVTGERDDLQTAADAAPEGGHTDGH
jgi:hypothetical protein